MAKDQQKELEDVYHVVECASGVMVTLVGSSHLHIMQIGFYGNQMPNQVQPMVGNIYHKFPCPMVLCLRVPITIF